jgi:hypothetical protein
MVDRRRTIVTYIVIFLWIGFAIFSIVENQSLAGLSTYFLSLTGFVGSYLYGESYRKSDKKYSVFENPAKCSKREAIIYVIIFIWSAAGLIGIYKQIDMSQLGSYFGALTPFVASYIIADTHKPEKEEGIKERVDREYENKKDKLRADQLPNNS